MPPTVTASTSGRSRLPLAVGAGARWLMHSSSSRLHAVGLGLPVAALQVVDNALKGLLRMPDLAPGAFVGHGELFTLGAVENGLYAPRRRGS